MTTVPQRTTSTQSVIPAFGLLLDGERDLRAGDCDREAVGEVLREHHGDGRLDTDELQDRLGSCYAAKTLGDLDDVLVDLPRRSEPQRSEPHRDTRRSARYRRAFLIVVGMLWFFTALAPVHHRHPGPPVVPVLILIAVLLVRRARRI